MNAPNHSDLYRGLGEVEGRLGAMEDRLEKIDGALERIDARLARIEGTESQRQGAFKFGQWVAGIVGAAVALIIQHFWK